MGDKVEALQLETRRKCISKWLEAPDPSTNYNRARRSRQADTGTWFTHSEEFVNWKALDASMLWLHGKPGCGKTVLLSTIISDLLDERQRNHEITVMYFFFDFNDSMKQKPEQMMRAVVAQLFTSSDETFAELETLFVAHDEGQRRPDPESWISALRGMICKTPQIFLVVDALDECCDIQELLTILSKIKSWNMPNLHILLTSRRLLAIEETLEHLIEPLYRIDIQSRLVNPDISKYVHDRLLADPGFRRWQNSPHVLEEIRSLLTAKADGMWVHPLLPDFCAITNGLAIRFRWAVCQLDALQRCPNLPTLRKALSCLPLSLDETYARILCDIPEEYSDYAVSILRWLTFSERPLRLLELAEVVTVNLEGEPWFDETSRFPDLKDILAICFGLVIIDEKKEEVTYEKSVVRLAHFSVKEYLISERIQSQKAAKYYVQEHQSHEYIATSCLAYILGFETLLRPILDLNCNRDVLRRNVSQAGPLLEYAFHWWTFHARHLDSQIGSLQRVSEEFLDVKRPAYKFWFTLFTRDVNPATVAPPLWQMAWHGVLGLVAQVLDRGADINEIFGPLGTALSVASRKGAEKVVRHLLLHGAEADLTYEGFGTPLQRACAGGHLNTARVLLAAGATANHGSKYDGTPLRGAVQSSKSPDLVRLLISAGADVKTNNEYLLRVWGSILTEACARRTQNSLLIVQYLLDGGADVNSIGGSCHTALQTACARRGADNGIVRLLLGRGAHIDATGGRYGTALQAASSCHSNDDVIKLLVERGADLNLIAGKYGTALQAVCAENHDNVDLVVYMLEKGAEVNAQGGKYRTALQAACARGNEKIVRLLLKERADTTITGGSWGSALHAACAGNHLEVISILCSHGFDVDFQAEPFGTPLHSSIRKYSLEAVHILLECGANVNLRASPYGTALELALSKDLFCKRTELIPLLLEHGADQKSLSQKQLDKLRRYTGHTPEEDMTNESEISSTIDTYET